MPPKTFTIFRGDARTIFMLIQNKDQNNKPIDLTYCTEIDLALPKADGTILHLLYTASQVAIMLPALLGQISAPISKVQSALLNVGEFQNFEATFTILSETFTVRFEGGLSVFEVK